MLITLSRYQKAIALLFYLIFYGELLASLAQVEVVSIRRSPQSAVLHNSIDHNFYHGAGNSSFVSDEFLSSKPNHETSQSANKAFIKLPDHSTAISPNKIKNDGPGPSQPEMLGFTPANTNNMVDLFTGDFTYNIPLMDVGGYPVNISYKSGVSMDQEASWVGLGWNINPGTISRNLRGLPDDFDGADSIKKISWVKENKTVGVTGGANVEFTGLPVGLGASLGVFYNNYKGWGVENSVNASIDAGIGASGALTGGLSINNNSQEGLTITPSFSVGFSTKETDEKSGLGGSFSTSLPYNSRTGLKGLQLSAGLRQTNTTQNEKRATITNPNGDVSNSTSSSFSSAIAFASPTAVPSITMPFTSRQYSFTGKIGLEATVIHPNFFISGYVSKQQIDPEDTLLSLPAYGYLYSQDGDKSKNPLLDYNREKELIYRDAPPVPNIAVPFYTYDAFSISGEGTGGMFRAYRGDIGYVHDHFIRTKDASTNGSVDVGIGDLVHAGVDVNISQSFTQNSAWLDQNTMRNVLTFRGSDTTFESSYFRNPGEKSINSKTFYNAIGGDDVVTVGLYQSTISSSTIQATNYFNRYENKKYVGRDTMTTQNATKPIRDKRAQVISYLTANEAGAVGLSKYIENYTPNNFGLSNCISNLTVSNGANGILGVYYPNLTFSGTPYTNIDDSINFFWDNSHPSIKTPYPSPTFPVDKFIVIWNARIMAPATGQYTFITTRDDGARLWINDSLLIDKFSDHSPTQDSVHVNLVAGQLYKFNLMFKEDKGNATIKLEWEYPGQVRQVIPAPFYYLPPEDVIPVNSNLTLERRVTSFRKPNHLSEIDVLNPDGRKYVYGIPVYNFRQKEATFAVNGQVNGNLSTGLVKFTNGVDNTTHNTNGQDNYFNSEEIPAYAHSFLLTGILSPDYVDLTGNGISDDDLGDAIKFKYSKVSGISNPYKWRAPYVKDSVTYNDGLKTDSRDDKGSYTYGEKELWYLHSIESKTMIATFVTEGRTDLLPIDESGRKYNDNSGRRLKEIDLYNKADFITNGTNAKPIKTVHFDYSYELCLGVNSPVLADSGKLTLKRIWFTYNGNNGKIRQNPYVFSYNTKNPRYNLSSYDRWGNYKDPLQNPGSTTGNVITNAEYPYALQDSTMASQNAAAWNLDSIYLPSGGSMKIVYESDDYGYVQNKRSMSLFKILGLGSAPGLTTIAPVLYQGSTDNLYIYVSVPSPVSTKQDVYQKYLSDIKKLYFRLFVQMPTDIYGKGSEYVSCYADLDTLNGYGTVSGKPNTIWIKVSGLDLKADGPGSYSPLAKASIQYLRLNLPSKAYPGSQIGDNLDLAAAVKMIFSLADNITTAFTNFDNTARTKVWAQKIDTSRSFVRLNSPLYQKFGGGYRVKQITIYDNWNKMTGQRTALYGQTYSYKTIKNIFGVDQLISSGVASWEPGIGGEENPFRVPIEYTEEMSVLGPVTMGYSEEPLGESLFPSPLVGYSKVRVRTINYKNIRSANGYEETGFYTAYDFPVFTDRTLIDADNKKRFKPSVANFLRINAKYYLAISQGFKVELNDMHGKLRSQGYYPENDPNNPVTYTENFYRVENQQAEQKKLSNIVMAMKQDGTIDTAALIGKDVELYVDMREQQSVTSGNNISVNTDMFAFPFLPPFFIIPSFLSLGQRQENKFRSVGTTKVIQRYGIIDSVIHIDKGSRITTQDLVYDAETGDVLLNRTQNEFNDPVYTFNYPAYWAYDAMGPAYKNMGAVASHLSISKGKINSGLSVPALDVFSAGDEIMVTGKQFTGTTGACTPFATFGGQAKVWAFDSAITGTGQSSLYLLDALGNPYTGNDVSVKVIRSGRRNLSGSVGSVTMLGNPLRKNGSNQYQIYIDTAAHVVTAAASEFKNTWKVESRNAQRTLTQITCPPKEYCYDTIPANYQATAVVTCFSPATYSLYTYYGAVIYSDSTSTSATVTIPDTTGFWTNMGNTTTGRLNQCGIWACGGCVSGDCNPYNTWIGFNKTVYNPTSDTVFIGMAGDNQVRITIDQTTVLQMLDPLSNGNPYYRWHIFPYYLPRGNHNFKVEGYNFGAQATFGAEVYNISRSLLLAADSNTVKAHTLFSTVTEAMIHDTFPVGYSCPLDYRLDSTGGHYNCIKEVPCICDTIYSVSCYNAITDTTINPYFTDILGNWRNYKSYTYYGLRSESDPTAPVNLRTNGTISNFAAFWSFQAGHIAPVYDTSRWVWNTQTTMFNKKGFELENKDPLGRYNSGLYGYNYSMPVAVVQNAQYRESAFEGFEDYGYTTQGCDTTCPTGRHFDFTAYAGKISTTQKHTGNSSLLLNAGDQVSVNVKMGTVVSDTVSGALTESIITDACASSQPVVGGVRANSSLVQPLFSPFTGKQMLISAWVKESQTCSCNTYVNNQIQIVMAGSTPTTLTFQPAGPIIEGWQRYESMFTVPSGDTSFTVSMKATGSVAAYFDDLRIEPFNANMKSFVYHPVSLRLMAELDENNYATFYEYDNDGTLIRVKKETEKGIQTIKETRSALFKQ